MHCRLLIPSLAAFGEVSGRRRPALELLAARGRRARSGFGSREEWLLQAFGVPQQDDWPSAPFALLGDGGDPGSGYWMHADPVHLEPDRDRLVVADAALGIGDDEAAALCRSLNDHFGGTLRVVRGASGRWYAELASPPPGATLALPRVSGRAVRTEAGSIQWHALMNEIQMLLHGHAVNEAREARGLPTVNGLWLWGGGRLTDTKPQQLACVLADEPLPAGLARRAGVPSRRLPHDARDWLARSDGEGVHLAVLPRPEPGDEEAFLDRLEADWAAPLAEALRHSRIGMVTVHFEGDGTVLDAETTRGDLRRVWRMRRPLHEYFTAS